jgi:hypothetical protein
MPAMTNGKMLTPERQARRIHGARKKKETRRRGSGGAFSEVISPWKRAA